MPTSRSLNGVEGRRGPKLASMAGLWQVSYGNPRRVYLDRELADTL